MNAATAEQGSPAPVLIVGGGLSGLAAGVHLVTRGMPATVLEQKQAPGGRAYSFTDAVTGETIDNGQHVLIAGYRRTLRFLEVIGTRHLLAIQHRPSLLFHHPERGFRRFDIPPLPAPLHLFAAILRTNLLSFADRLRLLRAGRLLRSSRPTAQEDRTIADWLHQSGQSQETIRSFWEPLAVSIMNEHTDVASAALFLRAIREAFLDDWHNAAMAIPRVGLSELYVDRALHVVEEGGGSVRCQHDVVEIMLEDGRASGVRLRDGRVMHAAAVILSVPPYALRRMLPAQLPEQLGVAAATDIRYQPIVSIHLWFSDDPMPHEFVGLIGRRIQWVFNKRKIAMEPLPGGHISAVISGASEFVEQPNDALIRIAVEDLRTAYPSAGEPVHAVVIREKRATFSSSPSTEILRPSQETAVPNLFLAGDWTDTGYPATIEGAIVSGERCADLALNYVRDGGR